MPRDNGYQVMVVEDETLILHHLIAKIEDLPLPLVVTATATNGEDALRLLRQNPPDILFTDIKMPIIDGLQLAKTIAEEYPSILVVIISGYSEFDYAQQAIRYHVSDYLLKPINNEKLLSVAGKLCGKLALQRRQTIGAVLSAAVSGTVSKAESAAAGVFYVSLIKIGNLYTKQTETLVYDAMEGFWRSAALCDWLEAHVQPPNDWWLSDIREFSYCVLITQCEDPELIQALFRHLQQITPDFSVNLCRYPDAAAPRELRRVIQSLTGDIHHSLVPCVSQCRLFRPDASYAIPPMPSGVYKNLLLLSKKGHIDVLDHYLCSLLSQWQAKQLPQGHLTKYILDLLKFLCKHNACCTIPRETILSAVQPVLADAKTDRQLYAQLTALIRQWVISAMSETHSSVDLYQLVKQYLEKNYQMPITIESLSDTFHFSPSYISRIFKKYEKHPPIQHLIQIRMTKAGELMKANPEMDVKIIAELVGYSNQHYFSRYFKQYFDVTPSEYKKGLQKGRPN